jgi:hypothetical protein
MSRRTLVIVVAGALVVVAGVVIVVVLTFMKNDTTAIDVDQARAAATSTTTSSPGTASTVAAGGTPTTPTAGGDAIVYVYDMSGHEEIDALMGARHEYPAQTYLTVQNGGCGQVWRWQAIEERWSSWEVCDPQTVTVAGFDSFNKWFGVEDLEDYRCGDGAPYLPPSPDTDTWTFVCATDAIEQDTTAEVVGMETLDVGGQQVDTLHIHYTDTLSGDSAGGSEEDRWFRVDDPLLVKEVASTASSSTSPIGTVHYTEEYEMTLQSLEPLDS